MHRKNGQEAFRPVMTMVAVVFAIAVGLVGAQATAEAAASGQVVSVRGVVVHRAPLLDRYSIIGPRGHLLPIVTDGALPPLGHGVLVSIRKTGAEFQQVSLSVGPVRRLVVLRGVVTYVGPQERRFVLSDGYSSIIIAHRLRGSLPGLNDRIVVRARITPVGRLVERALLDEGDHRDTIRLTGFVRYLIPPTSAGLETATEVLPAGSCVNGCAVITADDADQSSSAELIPIALPASDSAAASAAVAHKKKKKKREPIVDGLRQAITADPTAALSVSDTQIDPPAPVTLATGTVMTTGTIVISTPAAPTVPTTPPAPIVVAPPGSACPSGTVVAVPGYNCVPACASGSYLVENMSGTASSCEFDGALTYNPVQLPVPPLTSPPANVCQNDASGLAGAADGVTCEQDVGLTSLL
jgi:hypothetical protein